MKTLKELNVKGKRVLMRVDYNVPIKEGKITDDTRILATIPTLEYLIKQGSKIILMAHLGRPKGKVVPDMSLKPVAERLCEILKKEVKFATACIGKEVEQLVETMKEGEIILLENTRFYPEEEKNDKNFAKKLANLGDVYINEAFGSSHRAHASVEAVAHFFKEKGIGLLTEKELKYLSQLIEKTDHPYIAIMGGAKISTKIDIIKNIVQKVDKLLIGGGMVFTFFKSMGYSVGNSIVEDDKLSIAKEILEMGKDKIVLPTDIVIGDKFDNSAKKEIVDPKSIPTNWMGLDIGPKTTEQYSYIIENSKTIFWNGPTGVFEFDNFADSTKAICEKLSKMKAITVVGGGDTIAAVKKFNVYDKITHVSTGGGASLEFLSGIKLPGIEAIK